MSFLARPGIQEDEALFVSPFLRADRPLYSWHFAGVNVPIMLMDYIGGLKSWLYWPIFHFWPPSVWSIRLPVCLISVVTLVLFADLVRRVCNPRTAISAALFLATDAPFILTNAFDWGPVCLLLLGTVAFLSLLHRFVISGDRRILGAAFLIAGISVWYKAIFIFPLAAILVAGALTYGSEIRRDLSPRNVVLALIFFGLGSAPLIAFNLSHAGATFTASRYIGTAPISEKLLMLRRTLDGRALEHYMFRSSVGEKIPLAGAPLPELVASWYQQSQFHPGSALFPGVAIALLALPFLRNSPLIRPLLFTWISFAIAGGSMLMFQGAGAGPHHTVLLYPAPQFIVAATGAALSQRLRNFSAPAFIALSILVVGSNLWLLAQYHGAAGRNGFSVYWTDGGRNLASAIRSEALPVAFLDWGIEKGVEIETRDSIIVLPYPAPRKGVLYVAHCEGYVIDEPRSSQYRQLVAASEFRVSASRAVPDRQGRPIFCLFRLIDR
jgi:4-amino-4-deoxy-L-arabinose transferase-like glycosyltransferase